jgi:cytochrome b561
MWRNTKARYGLVSILVHWLTAMSAVGLFGLGLWMVDLTYYDDWYRTAPWLHKSIGIVVFSLLVFRLLWRLASPPPPPLPSHHRIERRAAKAVHILLYLILFGVTISGYLISTADGQAVSLFDLLSIPATLTRLPNQADWAGQIHLTLAISLMALATLHALAALKHHVIDRDQTLLRMIGRGKNNTDLTDRTRTCS